VLILLHCKVIIVSDIIIIITIIFKFVWRWFCETTKIQTRHWLLLLNATLHPHMSSFILYKTSRKYCTFHHHHS